LIFDIQTIAFYRAAWKTDAV